tara:strand:+ start:11000 stop:11173 length:174 start_codon:yes stop_codon:yes gene_type:complete
MRDLDLLKSISYGYRKFRWIQQQKELIEQDYDDLRTANSDHNARVLDELSPTEIPRA